MFRSFLHKALLVGLALWSVCCVGAFLVLLSVTPELSAQLARLLGEASAGPFYEERIGSVAVLGFLAVFFLWSVPVAALGVLALLARPPRR